MKKIINNIRYNSTSEKDDNRYVFLFFYLLIAINTILSLMFPSHPYYMDEEAIKATNIIIIIVFGALTLVAISQLYILMFSPNVNVSIFKHNSIDLQLTKEFPLYDVKDHISETFVDSVSIHYDKKEAEIYLLPEYEIRFGHVLPKTFEVEPMYIEAKKDGSVQVSETINIYKITTSDGKEKIVSKGKYERMKSNYEDSKTPYIYHTKTGDRYSLKKLFTKKK